MKRTIRILVLGLVLVLAAPAVKAQAIKTNVPLLLVGTPNVGMEFTVSQQFTTNLDILWMPYMFKKHEEVLRALVGSADLRYYVKPRYYYTNNMYDGFYLGPYVEAGNFNIGFWRGEERESYRCTRGGAFPWFVALMPKFYLSKRFRLDLNLGLGYAHLQYDKYQLGGEWADYPLELKDTRAWFGPTKFGVHLVYNLFR